MGLWYLFSEAVSCFDKVTTCPQGYDREKFWIISSLIVCPVSLRPGLWSQAFLSSVSNLACGPLLCLPRHGIEWCRLSKGRGQNSVMPNILPRCPCGASQHHTSPTFQQRIRNVDNSFHFRVPACFCSSLVFVQNLHAITHKPSILYAVLLCSSGVVPQALETPDSERM